ncbi:MAG: peroxide stress protein YaaA [Chlorobi bacterium]|nr:peroxide stress protein YaaA [Chlorobiota bacterium]
MIAVISPAKSLNENAYFPENLPFTQPLFTDKAARLVARLKKMTPSELAGLMKISDKLAALNAERYDRWSGEGAYPAVYLYAGDTYKGLNIGTFPLEKIPSLQNKVRIISGLYGLLRPLDLIEPYRLEMKTPVGAEGAENLYEYWKDDVTARLREELNGEPLINLASKEYASVIDREKLGAPVIDVEFKENRDGKLKTIGLFAKKARGHMARWIAENDIRTPEELKAYNGLSYRFVPELSDSRKFVFVR